MAVDLAPTTWAQHQLRFFEVPTIGDCSSYPSEFKILRYHHKHVNLWTFFLILLGYEGVKPIIGRPTYCACLHIYTESAPDEVTRFGGDVKKLCFREDGGEYFLAKSAYEPPIGIEVGIVRKGYSFVPPVVLCSIDLLIGYVEAWVSYIQSFIPCVG